MANKDFMLLNGIAEKVGELRASLFTEASLTTDTKVSCPIDEEMMLFLKKIDLKADNDDYAIFQYSSHVNLIWKKIIEKSITCLRYFDTREPFIKNPAKNPVAYGVSDLGTYFDRYSDFEAMLYGGGKYYRDHVIHVFRTWLLGLDCLLKNDAKYLEMISLGENTKVTRLEKLCIWSIIALTHDLGYPLEKSQEIIDKTKEMMRSFVSNPVVSMDVSFSGIQCNMNDFVLRFMSSKMVKKPELEKSDKPYVARLQPKYYFKFQKSLEKSMHGVISAIIIYKLLIYFLESDYSINEDYAFTEEDARQFYIRREILRSISSHTCKDIYHLDMLSFSYLLIVADDCQEWGRKKISELYVRSNTKYEFGEMQPSFNVSEIEVDSHLMKLHRTNITEDFTVPKDDMQGLQRIIFSLFSQFENYNTIFRDGQETSKRNFSFAKKSTVVYDGNEKVKFIIDFVTSNDANSSYSLSITKCGEDKINKKIEKKFVESTFDSKLFTLDITNTEDLCKYIISKVSNV